MIRLPTLAILTVIFTISLETAAGDPAMPVEIRPIPSQRPQDGLYPAQALTPDASHTLRLASVSLDARWKRGHDLYISLSQERIQASILWLVEKEPNNNPVKANVDYLRECALAFDESAAKYDLPVLLLLGMAYRESVYRPDEIGPAGEIGLLQVGDMGRRKCRKVCGKMETASEQVNCGACWLRMGIDWCHTLERGLTAYASGVCTTKKKQVLQTKRIKRVVHIRLNLWSLLLNL